MLHSTDLTCSCFHRPQNAPQLAFSRVLPLGSYHGADLNAFMHWLAGQLEAFAPHLPAYTASRMLLVKGGETLADVLLEGKP